MARRFFFRTLLFLGDGTCLLFSLRLAYWVRFRWAWFLGHFPLPGPELGRWHYGSLQWAILPIWWGVFFYSGLYGRVNLKSLDELIRVLRGVLTGWIIILAGTFLSRGIDFSRLVFGLNAVFAIWMVFGFREIAKYLYSRTFAQWGGVHRVLVLGSGRLSHSIKRVLSQHPELTLVEGSARTPSSLVHYLSSQQLKEVYVGEADLDHETLVSMSEVADQWNVRLLIVPDVLELRMGEVILDDSLGLPTFEVRPESLHGWTYLLKRVFDSALCFFLLALGFVPLLFVGFLIKLDSKGPVFFRQKRIGLRGRVFSIFKFRTMLQNAEDLKDSLKGQNEREGPVFKIKNDPRLTRVGTWLRRWSIDEIPQLINVLKGDMSLVGPRPPLPEEVDRYTTAAKRRLNVLPGITGLWQVSGRAQLSFDEMIELDVYYIEHWSPGLDLKILLKTIPTVLGRRGAY